MAEAQKKENQKTLGRQGVEIERADETIEAERTGPGGDLSKIAAVVPMEPKNKKRSWLSHRDKSKLRKAADNEKKKKQQEQAEIAAQKVEEDRVKAENKAREIQGKETLNTKAYEEEKVKLQLKIDIYIEEINALDVGFSDKLNTNHDDTISELISIGPQDGNTSNSLKIKLRECLKKLGSIMNLRESKQIDRINAYINNLKEANAIFKINQYLTEGNKLDETINFLDKQCKPQDSMGECQTKLTEALALFDTFKADMKKAYDGQAANEDKFKQLGIKVTDFKKEFEKWMEGLNELGNDPIEKLNGLKDTIQGYDVNPDLLGDEKDLKSNMVQEIDMLINTITI